MRCSKNLTKSFITLVYRKPTFTGQYTRWDSYGHTKENLSHRTLVHGALEICSPEKFSNEVNKIKTNSRQNGYPEVIISEINKKISNFQTSKRFGPEKCPVNKQSQPSTFVLDHCR